MRFFDLEEIHRGTIQSNQSFIALEDVSGGHKRVRSVSHSSDELN